ncbi:exodeoxyribonuclease VII large subunit [Actinomycetaceae bacterium TAE3-ERU4]|nr:exodeoxyribonuclease VII large subunit [Actinomycetaceae bacterium TAE3-ERU4]
MNQSLPRLAAETTRENPWPLRLLSEKMKGYIEKMSPVWIEGEVVELKIRPGQKMSFLTLRDLEGDAHISVALWPNAIMPVKDTLEPGSRVVVYARPTFWERSGSLQLQGAQIHLQGLGEMLARIEQLRQDLAAKGIFDEAHKKPLPFIPRTIGLICGEGAKAEQDVLVNARNRWPGAKFTIRHTYVQGDRCAPTVAAAIAELDALEDVDVIIVTRGGGAVADLLPFSDERIVMAAYQAKTPIVSAIGHETDCPLLDLVADYRASTPTDAARKVVPDLLQEQESLSQIMDRAKSLLLNRIKNEQEALSEIRQRPIFASPAAIIDTHAEEITRAKTVLNERIAKRVEVENATLKGLSLQLQALSPQSILERGYAVIRRPDRNVITDAKELKKGDLIEGMLAQGSFVGQIIGAQTANISREQAGSNQL